MISHNDIKGSSGGVNSSLFNLWPPAIGSGHDRGEIYMVIYGGGGGINPNLLKKSR